MRLRYNRPLTWLIRRVKLLNQGPWLCCRSTPAQTALCASDCHVLFVVFVPLFMFTFKFFWDLFYTSSVPMTSISLIICVNCIIVTPSHFFGHFLWFSNCFFFFHYYLATSTTNWVQNFIGLLSCAYDEIHQVRRLVFNNYQRYPVSLTIKLACSVSVINLWFT